MFDETKWRKLIINIVGVLLLFGVQIGVGPSPEVFGNDSCDRTACFQELKGELGDCSCHVDTIDYFNNVKIYPRLQSIVGKEYFRFYKVNLKKVCPFWVDDSRCAMRHCHIKACPQDKVPMYTSSLEDHSNEKASLKYTKEAQSDCDGESHNLGYLNMTISAESQSDLERRRAYDDALENFCVDDDDDVDAQYVDLTLNPERYTGYQGPSAHRIWRSIYEENCFRPKQSPYDKFPYVLNSDLSNLCLEKRVFYRAVSGLHSSINIHLCAKYLLSSKSDFTSEGVWGHNLEEFQRRFDPSYTQGQGPNWLKNLYFVYLLEMRALAKAGPYLEKEGYYTGDKIEDQETREAIKNLLGVIYKFPDHFNESTMFNGGSEAAKLKNEFREHFRNISRIMDCVGCDKCKLWGKLQIQGLGTALKILFSGKFDYTESGEALVEQQNERFQLSRKEIVSLFNAFGRLSNSIQELETFRTKLSKSGDDGPPNIFHQSESSTPISSSKVEGCRASNGAKPSDLWS